MTKTNDVVPDFWNIEDSLASNLSKTACFLKANIEF